jgi:hypothetical protein
MNQKPSEAAAVLARLDPVSQGAATVTTGWVAVKDWHRLLAILMVGALGASATVDAKIQQASDGSGTGAKDLTTAKSITQLTQAGTDSNKQVLINVEPDDLDLDNSFTHIRLSVTVATAACLIAALILGFNARFGSASDQDAATVDEIVG